MLPPAIFAPAQFRAANAVTFVVNGALGGFAFVFIPALEIIAGYSLVAGSALVPVTVVTLLLSGTSGRLAQRTGPRPPLVAGCLLCAMASMLAVRIGPHAGYWTAVLPLAVLFGLGLAALLPPRTASAMNSAPDSLAGLAGVGGGGGWWGCGWCWLGALWGCCATFITGWPHPGTAAGTHPDSGAPPRLPGRLPPRTATNPQTEQQPGNQPLPCHRYSVT